MFLLKKGQNNLHKGHFPTHLLKKKKDKQDQMLCYNYRSKRVDKAFKLNSELFKPCFPPLKHFLL